jgi:6-phosphogluconolactonase
MGATASAPLGTPTQQAETARHALRAAGVTDVLVLGMGTDGHTASLFPEAPNLSQALDQRNTDTCIAIELNNPPANAPYARITQTLAQILSARHIVLPLAGADKRRTLQQAWPHATPALPISYVLQQNQTPVALWLAN